MTGPDRTLPAAPPMAYLLNLFVFIASLEIAIISTPLRSVGAELTQERPLTNVIKILTFLRSSFYFITPLSLVRKSHSNVRNVFNTMDNMVFLW